MGKKGAKWEEGMRAEGGFAMPGPLNRYGSCAILSVPFKSVFSSECYESVIDTRAVLKSIKRIVFGGIYGIIEPLQNARQNARQNRWERTVPTTKIVARIEENAI